MAAHTVREDLIRDVLDGIRDDLVAFERKDMPARWGAAEVREFIVRRVNNQLAGTMPVAKRAAFERDLKRIK